MTVKHVGVPNAPRVRINRGDRKPPYLSNINANAVQEQLTPNGCAYNGPWPETERGGAIIGAEPAVVQPAEPWKTGNRSGE